MFNASCTLGCPYLPLTTPRASFFFVPPLSPASSSSQTRIDHPPLWIVLFASKPLAPTHTVCLHLRCPRTTPPVVATYFVHILVVIDPNSSSCFSTATRFFPALPHTSWSHHRHPSFDPSFDPIHVDHLHPISSSVALHPLGFALSSDFHLMSSTLSFADQ